MADEHRILDRLVATGAGCRTSEKCPEAVYAGPNKCGAKLEIPPGFVRFHAKNKVYEEVKVKVLRAAHVAINLKSGRG